MQPFFLLYFGKTLFDRKCLNALILYVDFNADGRPFNVLAPDSYFGPV